MPSLISAFQVSFEASILSFNLVSSVISMLCGRLSCITSAFIWIEFRYCILLNRVCNVVNFKSSRHLLINFVKVVRTSRKAQPQQRSTNKLKTPLDLNFCVRALYSRMHKYFDKVGALDGSSS